MSSSLLSGAEVREGSEEGSPLSEMEECGCQWEEGGDSVGVVVRGRGRGGVTLVRGGGTRLTVGARGDGQGGVRGGVTLVCSACAEGGMRVATVTEEKEQRVHGAVHKGEGV
ncbi:Os01g0529700 [Oryza sativa Japonica Group]|uniref:Os01g0529700 protein n=1 Tax=Oryza sativa subsp. japonica TaxID=39947 RepID=A0A0N7KD33_ORYSJ|nr:Os01g0529700 [Oryza sativa Japonica Group]